LGTTCLSQTKSNVLSEHGIALSLMSSLSQSKLSSLRVSHLFSKDSLPILVLAELMNFSLCGFLSLMYMVFLFRLARRVPEFRSILIKQLGTEYLTRLVGVAFFERAFKSFLYIWQDFILKADLKAWLGLNPQPKILVISQVPL